MNWVGIHQLVLQAKEGDQTFWSALEEAVRPYLLRLAQEKLGRNWAEQSASDLTQDTWVKAWRGIGEFQGADDDENTGAVLRAWLGKIMHNVYANQVRALTTGKRGSPDGRVPIRTTTESTISETGVDPPAKDRTPSSLVHSEERSEKIKTILRSLDDEHDREIIRLHYFEGVSLRQIAKQLGLSQDIVRSRHSACLVKLLPYLEGML